MKALLTLNAPDIDSASVMKEVLLQNVVVADRKQITISSMNEIMECTLLADSLRQLRKVLQSFIDSADSCLITILQFPKQDLSSYKLNVTLTIKGISTKFQCQEISIINQEQQLQLKGPDFQQLKLSVVRIIELMEQESVKPEKSTEESISEMI